MDKIFGPSGLLAQKMSSYEYRPEQNQMASAVHRAFAQDRFLIVEAGTGTGKTLAYLIPAVLSGKTSGHLHGNKNPPGAAYSSKMFPLSRNSSIYPFGPLS